jgi:hypothetical protein
VRQQRRPPWVWSPLPAAAARRSTRTHTMGDDDSRISDPADFVSFWRKKYM